MKPLLSHKNHFQFGYNGHSFTFRKSPQDSWFVRYGRSKRRPQSFKAECLRTAKTIRKNTDQPLHVMFSGGVDSEVVVRSFVEAKIEIQAAILRFADGLNAHDIEWAVKACENLGVKYKFYDLDLLKFWQHDWQNYSDPTYCTSPQLLPTMWLVDQIDGYPIMGSGECLLIRTDAPDKNDPPRSDYPAADWELYEKEKIAAWYRHFMIRGRDGCPGFFQYTPEIMLAYLQDPFVSDLCSNKIFGKFSTESSKLKIYQMHFPNLESRPKYTGYEKVQDEDAKLRRRLVEMYPGAGGIHKTQYAKLIDDLSPAKLNISLISMKLRKLFGVPDINY